MINIIGGTYREVNVDAGVHEIFGSGLRAASYFLENTDEMIKFHTTGNSETKKHLEYYNNVYPNFSFNLEDSKYLMTFKYYYSLDNPIILPNPNRVKDKPVHNVIKGDVVCFGMLDGDFLINANKVVYDPQTSVNPVKYSDIGTAKELIYIVNFNEAKAISGCDDITDAVCFFFEQESAKAVIVKNGPYGAVIYSGSDKSDIIPVYKTNQVNKIGSGDVFTAAFAFHWLSVNLPLKDCAIRASKVTSLFCETGSVNAINDSLEKHDFEELYARDLSQKQVYIAAPIFSLSDVIFVDKIRDSLLNFGVKVFSPYHDVGYGNEKEIADQDIRGLEESDVIFGVLDGLDSGTLVELGYSMSKEKKIIGYHKTLNEGPLLMLKGSKIRYYKDLTTALYQTIWSL